MNTLAQSSTKLGQLGGTSLGPFGNIQYGSGEQALRSVTGAISSIIGIMTVAAGIWFIFQFLIGGFYWITSGGDKGKLHEARERITNAGVGLLIVVAGWAVLALMGQFLGYDILINNPGDIIQKIQIR